MIPKIIHYCWFGKNPLPELAKKCIDSWKIYFPEYQIIEWNESNFDFKSCPYISEAYEEKKWAFVSDYARFFLLYKYGGIYFDTDVEVIKDMSEIINKGNFFGCEIPGVCAPGLGMGAEKGLEVYKEILLMYEKEHFRLENGRINNKTVVNYTTDILKIYGLKDTLNIQSVKGILIYPPEYFCPLSFYTKQINITKNTYTIHHYTGSWKSKEQLRIEEITNIFLKKFGEKNGRLLSKIIVFPIRLKAKINQIGWKKTLKIVLNMNIKGKRTEN